MRRLEPTASACVAGRLLTQPPDEDDHSYMHNRYGLFTFLQFCGRRFVRRGKRSTTAFVWQEPVAQRRLKSEEHLIVRLEPCV